MGNIVLLDELTINKIAAGEVIERPASVIKEMVENSIDAGANNITVEIQNGGISLIRVIDNGKGISSEDMEMAFERHATSKIRKAEDLANVKSMGFRGEALASIAAIANVEMVSRTKDSETGNKIIVEAGKILEKEETGASIGTSITVKNLFFNTPVRYKFLKKDYTESGYIEDAITRLALIHPEIAFKMINTGKTILQTTGNGDMQTVIYSIYGKDVANGILLVNYEMEDMKISGVIGKPEIARSNKSNQLFFVNKRFIKDKTLSAAADQAYKGMIPIGKFSFLVLNLDINPQKVDVNVHPAKLEVRFDDESSIFKTVFHAIKDTLLKAELISNTARIEDTVKTPETVAIGKIEPVQILASKPEEKNNAFSHILKKWGGKKEEVESPSVIESLYNKKNNIPNKKELEELPSVTAVEGKPEEEVGQDDIMKTIMDVKKKIRELGIETPSEEKAEIEAAAVEIASEAEQALKEKVNFVSDNTTEYRKDIGVSQNTAEYAITEEVQKQLEKNFKKQYLGEIEETEEDRILKNQETAEIRLPELQKIAEVKEPQIQESPKIEEPEFNPKELNTTFEEMFAQTFGEPPASVKKKQEEMKFNSVSYVKADNMSMFNQNIKEYDYKFVGIAFSTYIILEIKEELYILDQHAAHERIMYEKVKRNFYSEGEKDSQLMLIPDVITLTHKEIDIAKENKEMFEKAGFIFENFGDNTIKLMGVPNICIDLDTKQLFLDILDEIDTVARTARQEIEEKFIATIACKAAVKAHMSLTKEEVDTLMKDLLRLPNPFTCPHGRPTAIKMSKMDIEKKFSRR